MIPMAAGVRVWMSTGHTDMRKGMQGLALLVQEGLGRDPHAGDVFVFRGRSGALIKALWHDGLGVSLYAKRLDRGRFVWPATVDGAVAAGDEGTVRLRIPPALGVLDDPVFSNGNAILDPGSRLRFASACPG